ncbi:MAG: DUF5606 domain-containing protein [Muribaculaceae bacterium]|nr:DUF5606 domain-containing protein [Bacteroidales bacterium]MDE6243507.1 DUF5606 domain-containing protein [Muribaculaceae bacterium]
MLKTILSITGKPGLFKIVTNGKNMLLVEDIISGKRFPAHSRDKIVSLGDITMYTETEDVPLGEIFESAKKVYDAKPVDVKAMQAAGTLRDEFAKVLPDYDRDRVYDGDIRKFFSWYNLLLQAGITDFVAAEEKEATAEAAD